MSDHDTNTHPTASPLTLAAAPNRTKDKSPSRRAHALRLRGASATAAERSALLRTNLERLMDEAGMTPADVARKLGLSNGNLLYNFRSGRTETLSQRTLQALADAFGISVDELLGRTPWRGLAGRSPAPPDEPDREAAARGGRRKRRQSTPLAEGAPPDQAALHQAATAAIDALSASLTSLRIAAANVAHDADEVTQAIKALRSAGS